MPEAVIYPSKIKTDKDKLFACYSLIEQMRLEHNRQGVIAKADWKKYSLKWKEYSPIYHDKIKWILHERNLVRYQPRF